MPTLHGFALARMRRHTMKVVYITAQDVPTSEAIGSVLRKPIGEEALVDEIRRMLAS